MKRTMKKMVSLGLVAAISLTMLVGCGNSKETADNTASDNTAMIRVIQVSRRRQRQQRMLRLVF